VWTVVEVVLLLNEKVVEMVWQLWTMMKTMRAKMLMRMMTNSRITKPNCSQLPGNYLHSFFVAAVEFDD
jgi:hypothetical protein